MTNLFFILCWWVGVFTRPEPLNPHVMVEEFNFAKFNQHPVAKIEFAGRFILYDDKGREIISVNTKTGKVKLKGNPNEAAKRFWKAVEMMGGGEVKDELKGNIAHKDRTIAQLIDEKKALIADYMAHERLIAEQDAELIRLRAVNAELVEALEKLARLGNGNEYGNSDGNMIARAALSRAEQAGKAEGSWK